MNKIKYLILTIALVFIGIAGCKNQLEETVYSDLLTTNAYETEEDAMAATASVYAAMRYDYNGYYKATYIFVSEVPTDIGREGWETTGGPDREMAVGTWSNETDHIVTLWTAAYRMAGYANAAIQGISLVDMDETLKNRLLGEVRFLRALAYYDLTFYFGDVPLNIDRNDESLPLSPQSEVIAAIIKDLDFAVANLPNSYSEETGRATKGAALSLRAKTNLNAHNWQAAADDAKAVMDLGVNSLATSLAVLFDGDNRDNAEWIFTLKSLQNYDWNPYLASTLLSLWTVDYEFSSLGWTFTSVTNDFYRSFDLGDDRRGLISNGFESGSTSNWNAIEGTPEYNNPPPGYTVSAMSGAGILKYVNPAGTSPYGAGNNFPILRYADILLTRAEALNELSGGSAEAVSLVNQVKARSNAPLLGAGLSQTQLRDAILDERGYEFFFEGKRRIDLIRHDKLISKWKAALQARIPGANFDYITKETHTYFPIPLEEIDTNDNING